VTASAAMTTTSGATVCKTTPDADPAAQDT
jgi:hypothetical protein